MTKERYDEIRTWFLLHPVQLNSMKALNRWLPRVVYCVYPLLLVSLALRRDERFFRVLLVPAVVFGTVTLLRRIWNFPRPYEKLGIEPLIPREKKGHSFPSRHVASVTIIAIACWYVWIPFGIAMSIIALLISVIRPLAGIHFPRDVIAGFAFSLIIGLVGFWII
ncbi:MAG: phosphatase PAP2 family protein [Intestinimonas sp.]|nr:phosphatase PAP2 family protein [Intestinimonas sp.]